MDTGLYKKIADGLAPIVDRVITGSSSGRSTTLTIDQDQTGDKWDTDITIPEVDTTRYMLEYGIAFFNMNSYVQLTGTCYLKDSTTLHVRIVGKRNDNTTKVWFELHYRIIEFVRGGYDLLINSLRLLQNRNEVIA